MATQHKVLAGPNKFELMLSLFEGKRVTFTVPTLNGEQKVLITSIETEDGSHESWNIKGSLTQMDWQKFAGYYDTRTRKGLIQVAYEQHPSGKRTPKNGDRAYTKYGGNRYEGVLQDLNTTDYPRGLTPGKLMPTGSSDWGIHSHAGLRVGYEEALTWDNTVGMWYAPADSD